jgi:antitoxin component of RelBE/YafQ-DinJ toxin-antitoxin module
MATVTVNARLDQRTKTRADVVLASENRTWSQAIQALASYLDRTQRFPSELVEPPSEARERERQRRHDALMALAGSLASPDLQTDRDTQRVLDEEMVRRFG